MYRDRIRITVHGGKGGDGCVSFRREKYAPKGGPDGGDGGRGGDVIVRVDSSLDDLSHLKSAGTYAAGNGRPGSGGKKHGRDGDPFLLTVPEGTTVYLEDTGAVVLDCACAEGEVVVARGGRGGRGNVHFATPTDRAPRKSEKGREGSRAGLRLEYVPAVDVCIVGRPNSGKSALLAALSGAKPRIAEYPYTTVMPAFGTFSGVDGRQVKVMELPATLAASRDGKRSSRRWIGHVARSKLLLFIVDITLEREENAYEALLAEMSSLDRSVSRKPRILALSKIDLSNGKEEKLPVERKRKTVTQRISLVTGEGVKELKAKVLEMLGSELDGECRRG